MVRNVVKGGVWKNTEDQVLIAAVMKYGVNQWARISSLLVRKSAKQCKARWFEWLDPNIKKIEWSREEEEKLLHLVKIMPNQWRTIAPVVGRTAAQCLEHYEKLLDRAQGKEDGVDEARKLRPGEIDPMPESKPAKPDPVDMDEDEKEMLQEARARLANTKGKKAKRKAREKQLDEARRLASLQKRREMKAAGMDMSRRKFKVRGIDYNKEIPFEHRPAPGFFDPAEELSRERLAKEFRPPTLAANADVPKRSQIEERNRREDARRMDDKKKADLPAALAQLARMNNPEQIRKRSKLNLPEPQLTDRELEDIAKMGAAAPEPGGEDEGAAAAAAAAVKRPTQMLLSRYDATPATAAGGGFGATPLRNVLPPPAATRTPARPDALLQEAQTLAAMATAQTPLIGGANPAMATDFGGITPARPTVATPSALARATPRVRAAAAAVGNLTGLRTPLRDELHLNDERSVTSEESRREERLRQDAIRRQVQDGLFKLPAPRNEYQIVVPAGAEHDDEAQQRDEAAVPDAADVAAQEAAKTRAAHEQLLRERSTVLRRALPRPLTVESSLLVGAAAAGDLSAAEALVRREMHTILLHDAAHFPVGKAPVKLPPGAAFERFSDEQLRNAQTLIDAELRDMLPALPSAAELAAAWERLAERGGALLPEQGEARVEALRRQFETVKVIVTREGKKAAKLEQKVALLHGGYDSVARAAARDAQEAAQRLAETDTELACFRALRAQELLTAPARVAALRQEVTHLKDREGELQNRYADLSVDLQQLQTGQSAAAAVEMRQ